METLKELWNKTCLQAGIPALSMDTSARILAVIYVHGNNEEMTHNTTFLADVKYIQKRFGISGGRTPDADFSMALKEYIKELEDFEREHKDDTPENGVAFKAHVPQWAVLLFKERYNIKLIN